MILSYLKLFYFDNFFKLIILLFQAAKDVKAENIKARCAKVFEKTFAHYSRTRILNSCSDLRLGWEMALCPSERRVVADLDAYDLLNNLEAGNYDQRYYIENEDLKIDFLAEDDEDDQVEEDLEDIQIQQKTHENPLETGNVPSTSFRNFDDLINITFSHPIPSTRITLKWLANMQTHESRIDPIDQSSTSIAATTSKRLEVPAAAEPPSSPAGQEGMSI